MHIYRDIRILACWLVLAVFLPAQQYASRAFRQADGLGNLSAKALTVDSSGFIWVATEDGAYRFLGSGFQRFGPEQGLMDLDVRDIATDPDGALWAVTDENLYRWTGSRFLPAGPTPIATSGSRRLAFEDPRHMLILEGGMLYRLEHEADGRFVRNVPAFLPALLASFPELKNAHAVSVTRRLTGEVQIWIGAGTRLYSVPVACVDSPQAQCAGLTEWSSENGIPDDQWTQVLMDRTGTTWAAGTAHICVLSPSGDRFVDRTPPGAGPGQGKGFSPLVEDPDGGILAPADKMIARWNGLDWQFTGRNNGLNRSRAIVGMAFDSAGDLFIASSGDGVHEWAGYTNWEGWNDDQTLPSVSIWDMVPDSGRLILATDHGIASLDPRTRTFSRFSNPAPWASGQAVSQDQNPDGSFWIGYSSGHLARFDPRRGKLELIAKVPETLINGFRDAAGHLFLLTTQGVYGTDTANPKEAPHQLTQVDAALGGPAGHSVSAGCASPDGTVWLIANNRPLQVKNGVWSFSPVDGMPPLRGTVLSAFCTRNNSLWITGDQTGTWLLTPQNGRLKAWQLVLPAPLRSLSALTVRVDHRGWVWLGTDLGVAVWNGSQWRHLTEESGLIWNDTNQGAIREASDGSMWFGTTGGLSHLLRPDRVFDPVPLSLAVTEVHRGDQDFSEIQQVTIPEAGLPLKIHFSWPTVHNRSELQFKDSEPGTDWVENTSGVLVFPKLHPGTRTLFGRVCDPVAGDCSSTVQIELKILPSWYHSTWFYTLCTVFGVLILLAIGRQYLLNLQGRSRELERIVAERTHELEASREMLRIQATHDGLTGLLNRNAILMSLAEEMERCRREGNTLVLALADLDHFKKINDSFGHLAGDEALRQFAAAIRGAIRPYDHSGRYGGEEFLMVLTHIDPGAVEQRLAALHASISDLSVRTSAAGFRVYCSVGATFVTPSEEHVEGDVLLSLADKALYEAKADGRNRVVIKSYSESKIAIND